MSGTNLGKLLVEAGVKGGKEISPKITWEELKAAAHVKPEEVHVQEAMNRLPPEFLPLLEVSKAEDFMSALRALLDPWDGDPITVTEHTVFGLVQMVHFHRDRLSGSRRKGFDRLVSRFLEIKKRVLKNPPADLAAFVLRNL